MNYFNSIYGLVTKTDPGTENGGLFLAHYLVLKKMLGIEIDALDNGVFTLKMANSCVALGIYLRSANHRNRTVSQDEQTGFSVASYLCGTSHRFLIWHNLLMCLGNYPATGKTKFYNPGSYYAWAVLADSHISFILAPWYTINLLISTNKVASNTSSKLIYLDELYCMKDKSWYSNILWKYYSWRMKRMYGVKWVAALYDIYFGAEDMDHPLRELSHRITT